MATPGERFKKWLDDFGQEVKERLKGWLAVVLGFGIEVFEDTLAKSMAPKLKPVIDSMRAAGPIAPELEAILKEIESPTGEAAASFGRMFIRQTAMNGFSTVLDHVFIPAAYRLNSMHPIYIFEMMNAATLFFKGEITKEQYIDNIRRHGYNEWQAEKFLKLIEVRLPSEVVGPVWLRDKTRWDKYWDDVKQGGVTDDRIELLKEYAYRMPSPPELITMMAHEAFEEDSVQRYGLDDEYDRLEASWFDKVGIHPDARKLFWRSHWVHPSYGQVTDMLHRGLRKPDGSEFTEADVYEWFRVVEIPPFWRDMLTELSWDLPNRIEVRMMARYGLVGKPFLLDILKKVGLRSDYRDVVADMMIAMGVRTDVATRYSKGWINKTQVKSELDATGLSAEVSGRLYQWIVKNVSEERVAPERDLTVTDLVTAYKKGFLTFDETVERIMELGYDEEEAILKIAIKVEIEAGSPQNKAEAKRLTDLYRTAVGLPTDRTKEEIIQAEKAVAAKYPRPKALTQEEVKTRVDTIRRKRRRNELGRDEEVTELLKVGLDVSLAEAYAENDDLRVRAV